MDATLPVAHTSKSWIARQRDQFAADWNAGLEPRIEEILAKLPPEHYQAMLGELLGAEIELRHRRGDAIQRREYEGRFPAINRQQLDRFQSALAADPDKTLTNAEVGTSANLSGEGSTVTTAARFRDLRLFRKGGLGALFRAHDESLHREAVVKFMNEHCENDPALQTQFRVEAEITSRLDHPGIVPVYGSGEDWHGRPFYVMRLINGRELRESIQEYHQAGGPSQRGGKNRQLLFGLLEHLVSACNTIAYAHHVGIVHCDIKPANIMIGKYGETFVLDWGLASPFERSATFIQPGERTIRPNTLSHGSSSGQRGGTYGYISPEQLCGDGPLTPTSDVYSLGATLYEILTGRAPFCGRDRDVGEKIRLGQFSPPRGVQRNLPRGLEAICLKAMSLSPQERYPSAKHLAADLTNWMRDERIAALPDRWWNRAARLARHHWGLTVAGCLIGFAALVAAGALYNYRKAAAHGEELQAARNLEKQGFTGALDTFEDLCRPLANGQLNGLAAFDPIVRNIDGFANDYLQSFDKTESMRLHTARVLELRATVLQFYAKDLARAADDYERAESLYQQLTSADGDSEQNDVWLAHCRLGWGRLCVHRPASDKRTSTQYNDLAIRLLNEAAESYKQLAAQQPEEVSLLRDLAETHHCLGEAWFNRDDEENRQEALEKAEAHFNQGKQIRVNLVQSTSGAARHDHERDVARSLGYLGDLYLAQGEVRRAAEAYEGSKDRRKVLYDNSHDPEHRFQYARGLANFGALDLGYRGKFVEAIQRLEDAAKLQRELTAQFPEVGSFSRDLASTLTTQAELFLLAASLETDTAKAAEHIRRGLQATAAADAIYRPDRNRPVDSEHISGLSLNLVISAALQRSSEPEKCKQLAAEAESLLYKLGTEDAQRRSDLVTLALARSLQSRGDSALNALKEAVRRGENTAERFERHSACGFQSLASDPRLQQQFTDLCQQVRSTLKVQ